MPIRVRCDGCGKTYNAQEAMAGRQVRCPACGGVIVVPAAEAWTAPPEVPPQVPTLAPAAPTAAWPAPGSTNAPLHIKLVGVFNIIAGILNALWGLLMLVEMVVVGVAPEMLDMGPDDPPQGVMIAVFAGMLLLSLGTAVIQILAGVWVLRRRPGARKLGLVAGFLGCGSLWGCCVWPLCLAAGIYTLIALFKDSVREALESGAPPL